MALKVHKSFTLIELIAVVIILGIVAVTAIPRYYDLKTKAEDSVAEGVLASAQSALAINWSAVLSGSAGVQLIETATDLLNEMDELDDNWVVADQTVTWTTGGGDQYVLTLSDSGTEYGNKKSK